MGLNCYYVVDCEWEMEGLEGEVFSTEQEAWEAIEKVDWETLVGMKEEIIINDGRISVEKLQIAGV